MSLSLGEGPCVHLPGHQPLTSRETDKKGGMPRCRFGRNECWVENGDAGETDRRWRFPVYQVAVEKRCGDGGGGVSQR
jgi:hypothetical protein